VLMERFRILNELDAWWIETGLQRSISAIRKSRYCFSSIVLTTTTDQTVPMINPPSR
jgi:hypothetical protein